MVGSICYQARPKKPSWRSGCGGCPEELEQQTIFFQLLKKDRECGLDPGSVLR